MPLYIRPSLVSMLLLHLLLPTLLLWLLKPAAGGGSAEPAASAAVEVFNFDYTWTPGRPVPNDTVVFRATASQSSTDRWNLTDDSFRWYQQLPGSGFHLRHVGRSYVRNASEAHFEGRYRLRVLVTQRPMLPQSDWEGNQLVDVVKYVGLQKQIDVALLVNASQTGSSGERRLVCRFWGWPLIETLQFLPAADSKCERQHFETNEAEPHIDLVVLCPRLAPGSYSCYGRNAVGASQLTCELTDREGLLPGSCYQPSLADPPSVKSIGAQQSVSKSRVASGQGYLLASVVTMATSGLALVLAKLQ